MNDIKQRICLYRRMVRITRKHIRNGKQASGDSCPIALALREMCKPNVKISVDYIFKIWDDILYEFVGPNVAFEFIQQFDKKKSSVKPISFELYLPAEYLK